MSDLADLLIRPFAIAVLWVLRAVLWIGLELMLSTIGWSIGWCLCRALSLGRIPSVGIREEAGYDWLPRILVEIIGLGGLALLIWWLASVLNA